MARNNKRKRTHQRSSNKRGSAADKTAHHIRTMYTPAIHKYTNCYRYKAKDMLTVEVKDTETNLVDGETCESIKDLVAGFAAEECPEGAKLLEDYRINARLVSRDDQQKKPEGLRTLAFCSGEEIHLFITDFWRDQTICKVVRTLVEPAKEASGVGQIAIVLPTKVRKIQPLIVRDNLMTGENGNFIDEGMTVLHWNNLCEEKLGKFVKDPDITKLKSTVNRERDLVLFRLVVDHFLPIPCDVTMGCMFWGNSTAAHFREKLEVEGYKFESDNEDRQGWVHGQGFSDRWLCTQRPPTEEEQRLVDHAAFDKLDAGKRQEVMAMIAGWGEG